MPARFLLNIRVVIARVPALQGHQVEAERDLGGLVGLDEARVLDPEVKADPGVQVEVGVLEHQHRGHVVPQGRVAAPDVRVGSGDRLGSVDKMSTSNHEWLAKCMFVKSLSDSIMVINEHPSMNHNLHLVVLQGGHTLSPISQQSHDLFKLLSLVDLSVCSYEKNQVR